MLPLRCCGEPEEPEGDLCYEDFALQLLREECGRRSVPCPATLVPAEAVDEVYAADLETEEIRRVREAFPTADQWAPPAEDDLLDGDSSDGDEPLGPLDEACDWAAFEEAGGCFELAFPIIVEDDDDEVELRDSSPPNSSILPKQG